MNEEYEYEQIGYEEVPTRNVITNIMVPCSPEEKINSLVSFGSQTPNSFMSNVNNQPMFDLASHNLNQMGHIDVSEKIRRMLQ